MAPAYSKKFGRRTLGKACRPRGIRGIQHSNSVAGLERRAGDGTQTRDFTFVSDAIDALLAAADRGRPGEAYNVGTGEPVSINELVRLLGPSATVHVAKRPGEPDCTSADIIKIRAELGWSPKVGFGDGVRVMLDNIDYWRDAPVWTVDGIAEATRGWFRHLGTSEGDRGG